MSKRIQSKLEWVMGPVYPRYLIEGVVYLHFIDCNCNYFRKFGLYYLFTIHTLKYYGLQTKKKKNILNTYC